MADEYKHFERLILADGTVLQDCSCGYANKELWCFLKNRTMFDAIQYFSDPNHFSKLVYEFGVPINFNRITYIGAKELITVDQQEKQTDIRLVGDHIEKTEELILSSIGGEQTS